VRFGEKLQELRLKAGMSQGALAEASGLSVRNIQNWEISYRLPRADALFQLAAALGTDCRAFAECVEKPAKKAAKKRRGE